MVKIKAQSIKNSTIKKKKPTVRGNKTKKAINYESMSVDDFFNENFKLSESEVEEEDSVTKPTPKKNKKPQKSKKNIKQNGKNKKTEVEEEEVVEEDEEGSDVSEDEFVEHKKALNKLKDTDPEFYQFLQENDKKLLEFNLSDADDEEEEVEEADEESNVHKPPDKLDVASDESDYEPEEDELKTPSDQGVITLKLLKQWQTDIQTDKTTKTISALVNAFHAALMRVSPEDDAPKGPFKVEGSSVFNGVIQLCVVELGPAIRRFLGMTQNKKQPPHKYKKFKKIKATLRNYFLDLLKLLQGVTSPNIQTVLLKHLHYLSPMLVSFTNIAKLILKRLIKIWGTADENVRVVAFFCILRITTNQQSTYLEMVLKSMYMTYVKNTKFVSVTNLATINFMRRSLAEMFALDLNVSYQHVFLYIRQLAIHLRNAITVNKKENIQTVYNWQYVNSLKLWGNLLSLTCNKPQLQPLIYPFVQVCLGTIKLIPTTQYYPLRFHIIKILMELSKNIGMFIPILPFILEILSTYDFNKKHQKVSMKPLNFTCILRLSKSQLVENGFKDAVIENIYENLLEYLAENSSSIAFPDLALLCVLQIKGFLKKCHNANYNRKFKQILEKIEENAIFIENERKKVSFNLTDIKQIEGWQSQIKVKGTPLIKYYESWNKINNIKKNKEITNNDALADYKLPTIKKKPMDKKKEKTEGPVELFPSDSENEDNEDELTNGKRKRGKRGGKNSNKKIRDESGPVEDNGEKDIVQDLQLSDW